MVRSGFSKRNSGTFFIYIYTNMMRQHFFVGMLTLLTLIPCKGLGADQLMPQFGKQVITVTADNPVTYYDYKGTDNIPSAASSNSFATTIFKPAEDGNAIQIVFEEIDLHNDGESWPATLSVYNGVFDTLSITYPTATNGVTAEGFPSTDALIEALEGTYTNLTYTSADPTGALSCCFHYRYAGLSKGWKAIVSSIKVAPMQTLSAATDYTRVQADIYPNKQDVSLAGFNVLTEGLLPADALTSVSFTLAQTGVFDASQLNLYAGNAESTAALKPVEAMLTELDGTYTFTCNQPLSSGQNQFCIGGSVLASAPFNQTSSLTLTGLTTNKGFSALTVAGTPVIQKVAAMVLMANGTQELTVTQPVSLYDDGGPEGKISNNFSGTYTFRPSTQGKKIMLDMQDISIFYTSSAVSVGNQDILAIYSGSTTETKNLLYTVQTDKMEQLVLKSTAEDGALTVKLTSKTPASYYQGNGFQATVSEFTPQPMEMLGATVSKPVNTPAACATGVEALGFTLNTLHTEPALRPTAFRFTTNNTYAHITHAALFYKGTKVGETDVTADEFTVSATDIVLAEGENPFTLTLDFSCTAQTGDKVEANISQVTFSDATVFTAFTNPEGGLVFRNTAYSDCGTQTVSVLGEWQFTHTVASEYSDDYKAEDCDQITVFRPATEGHIIQLDFADFDLYYGSSSYSTRATFQVYAGEGTTGDLLWELNADNKTTGPGLLRSTSTDGVLTVLFNPQTTSSYYTGSGFHATVTEYLPTDMVASTPIAQLPEQQPALAPATLHAPLLQLNLPTTGILNPLTFDKIELLLPEDNLAALDSVLIMQGTQVIAKAEVKAASLQLPLAGISLKEGDNIFFLAANIAPDAPIGTNISITSLSVTVSGGTSVVSLPENSRPVVNVYCLETAYNKISVGSDPLTFYDAGGPTANLSSYGKGEVTFVPTVPNTAIQLKVKQWNINGADNFYIYYADTVQTESDLSLSYYTDNIQDLLIISEAESGELTVKYQGSYNSSLNQGWEIEVSCHELKSLAIDSVLVSSVSAGVATKGSQNIPMLQVAVFVSGDRGEINVSDIAATAPEGTALRIYTTGQAAAFATTTPFDPNGRITRRGTYYYWLALDVDADAAEGQRTLTCTGLTIDNTPLQPLRNAVATLKIISGMHGEYRIGAGETTDFKTIQAAVDALQIGIDGAVTFLIEPGVYTERINVPQLTGLSAVNTLTFASATGDSADVIIHHEDYNTVYGDEYGVFTIDGADYLTLRDLTLYTENTAYDAVICLRNVSRHITVERCHIHAPIIDSGTAKTRLVYTKAGDEENQNNDYFTLSNSLLEGGHIGMYLGGTSYVANPHQVGGQIISNTFSGQGSQSLYVTSESNILIHGNRFFNTVTTKNDFKAMDLRLYDGGTISGNYICLNLTNYCEGIYLRQVKNTATTPTSLFNNAVYINSTATSTSYALNLTQAAEYLNVDNNTFYTTAENATVMIVRKQPVALQVRNNILYNAAPSATATGLAFQVSGTWSENIGFATNLLYTAGTTLARLSTTDMANLSDWQTTMSDRTAVSELVAFKDSTLALAKAGNLQTGTPLEYITTDLQGNLRAAIPTLGAYEYIEATVPTDWNTGSLQPSATEPCKILRNGQLLIICQGVIYDIYGRRYETAE